MHLTFAEDAGHDMVGGLPSPRHVEFVQDGPGTAECVGKVAGQTVHGNGTASVDGTVDFDALCLRGVGTGSIEIRVPRFIAFFRPSWETLKGTFDLDLSELSWRQVGSVVDTAGEATSFAGVSHFTPDSGHACDVRSGTLTGRLVAGGSYAKGPERPASEPEQAAPTPAPASTSAKSQPAKPRSRKAKRCKTRSASANRKARQTARKKATRRTCARRTKRAR